MSVLSLTGMPQLTEVRLSVAGVYSAANAAISKDVSGRDDKFGPDYWVTVILITRSILALYMVEGGSNSHQFPHYLLLGTSGLSVLVRCWA
jgi:hypothetical protein